MDTIDAKGANGTLSFDGEYVEIQRKRGFAHGKGTKRIPVSQITAIRWKDASALVGGFIAFTVPGHVQNRVDHQTQIGLATFDAMNDEYAVVFPKKRTSDFEAIRKSIDEAIAAHQAPAAPAASGASELARFAELHAAGALSDDEFATAKARILAAL